MKRFTLILPMFVLLNAGISSANASMTLAQSSLKTHPITEFTGKLKQVTYCRKGDASPCYQPANEKLIRANIVAASGSNIIIDFKGDDLAFGEKLIALVGKNIHAKISPNPSSDYSHDDVEYLDISE